MVESPHSPTTMCVGRDWVAAQGRASVSVSEPQQHYSRRKRSLSLKCRPVNEAQVAEGAQDPAWESWKPRTGRESDEPGLSVKKRFGSAASLKSIQPAGRMPPGSCSPGWARGPTFLEEPPGPEEGVPQQQAGPQVLLEAGVQPLHQRMDGGMAEAEGGRGEHVGHGGVHAGVVAPVGAHVPPKGLGAQDSGDIIAQRDDLQTKESWWEPSSDTGSQPGPRGGAPFLHKPGGRHTPRVVFGGHAIWQGSRR